MLTRLDLKNTVSLVAAEGVSRVMAFVLTIYIARSLGVYDFGAYSTAVSFVFLFSVFIEIGLSTYVYREISKNNAASTQYINGALILQIILSVVAGLAVFVAADIANYPLETRIIISLLWFWMIAISLGRMIRVVFKAHQRMEFDALGTIIENGTRFILVFLALHFGHGVRGIAIASIASALLMLGVSLWLATSGKYIYLNQMQWDTTFLIGLLKAAWPFALSMIASVVMYRISVVVLSIMQGDYAVGIFNASFKFTMALFFIPGLICNAFFPKLSQLNNTNNIDFSKIIILLMRYIFMLMYPILMVIFIFSPQIIGLIYTDDFSPTISLLQILVWVNFFNSGTYIGIYALNAANYEKTVMKVMFVGISVKVATTVIMVMLRSYTGAAISALISEIIVTVLLFYSLQRRKKNIHFSGVVKNIVIVTIVSFSAILFAQWLDLNNLLVLLFFLLSFLVSVAFFKIATIRDVSNIRNLFSPSITSG